MRKYVLAGVALSRLLEAQPSGAKAVSVPPGKQSDIIVAVTSPRIGDMLDVLIGNSHGGVRVEFFLPDGRELTDNVINQNDFVLSGLSEADLAVVARTTRKALLSGPGNHLTLNFAYKPIGGNYRIRVDNRPGTTAVRVAAAFVPIAGIRLGSFRSIPGLKIINAVKIPPGSKGVKLKMDLTRSAGAALIDIACTRDQVAIRLRLPDGSILTQENAKTYYEIYGLEWQQIPYPNNELREKPELAILLGLTMLPVDGMHFEISFPAGVPQDGTYTVEADGQGSAMANVTAMFLPLRGVEGVPWAAKEIQRLMIPPLK